MRRNVVPVFLDNPVQVISGSGSIKKDSSRVELNPTESGSTYTLGEGLEYGQILIIKNEGSINASLTLSNNYEYQDSSYDISSGEKVTYMWDGSSWTLFNKKSSLAPYTYTYDFSFDRSAPTTNTPSSSPSEDTIGNRNGYSTTEYDQDIATVSDCVKITYQTTSNTLYQSGIAFAGGEIRPHSYYDTDGSTSLTEYNGSIFGFPSDLTAYSTYDVSVDLYISSTASPQDLSDIQNFRMGLWPAGVSTAFSNLPASQPFSVPNRVWTTLSVTGQTVPNEHVSTFNPSLVFPPVCFGLRASEEDTNAPRPFNPGDFYAIKNFTVTLYP